MRGLGRVLHRLTSFRTCARSAEPCVIDGDTFCFARMTIRIADIDAPILDERQPARSIDGEAVRGYLGRSGSPVRRLPIQRLTIVPNPRAGLIHMHVRPIARASLIASVGNLALLADRLPHHRRAKRPFVRHSIPPMSAARIRPISAGGCPAGPAMVNSTGAHRDCPFAPQPAGRGDARQAPTGRAQSNFVHQGRLSAHARDADAQDGKRSG